MLGGAAAFCAALAVAGCGGSGPAKGDDALVFVSTRDGPYELYTSTVAGKHQTRLTKDHGDASTPEGLIYQKDPAWSPDGQAIAFSSSREARLHIFVVDASGKTTTRLTSGSGEDSHPTWSPDGKRIAFARGTPNEIEIVKVDGSGAQRLDSGAAAEDDPAWSPDGRWIAYDRRVPGTSVKEIWIAHPDGTAAHAVTKLRAMSTWPTWSPDGKRIAFSSNVRGGHYAIYSIAVAGGALRLVSGSSTDEVQPAWSPDGKSVAFSRDGAIVVVPAGRGAESVITSAKNNDSSPAWNPKPAAPQAKGY